MAVVVVVFTKSNFAQIQNESFQKINQNWKFLKSSFSLFVMKNHESIMFLFRINKIKKIRVTSHFACIKSSFVLYRDPMVWRPRQPTFYRKLARDVDWIEKFVLFCFFYFCGIGGLGGGSSVSHFTFGLFFYIFICMFKFVF